MKIIDLLNKIANGEEVPKKIKYKNIEYEYEDIGYYNKQRGYLFDGYYVDGILNDEVEILEEEDKIEKCIRRIISHNFCITDDNYEERFEVIRKSIEDNANEIEYTKAKINELIDEVNKLKENK